MSSPTHSTDDLLDDELGAAILALPPALRKARLDEEIARLERGEPELAENTPSDSERQAEGPVSKGKEKGKGRGKGRGKGKKVSKTV